MVLRTGRGPFPHIYLTLGVGWRTSPVSSNQVCFWCTVHYYHLVYGFSPATPRISASSVRCHIVDTAVFAKIRSWGPRGVCPVFPLGLLHQSWPHNGISNGATAISTFMQCTPKDRYKRNYVERYRAKNTENHYIIDALA